MWCLTDLALWQCGQCRSRFAVEAPGAHSAGLAAAIWKKDCWGQTPALFPKTHRALPPFERTRVPAPLTNRLLIQSFGWPFQLMLHGMSQECYHSLQPLLQGAKFFWEIQVNVCWTQDIEPKNQLL